MHQKYLIALLIFAGMSFNSLFAQNPSEAFIQQASFDHNEAVLQFTGDFTTAFGGQMDLSSFDQFDTDANVAIVNQFGDNNISGLIQNGIGNMVRMNIFGSRNTTGLTQNGANNRFILNLEGNDSIINSEQSGANNQMRLDLIGTFPNQTFSQIGSGHTLELIDMGNGGIPMEIEQRGNGATAIIENY